MIPTMDFETYSEAGYEFNPALGRFVPLQKGKPGLKGINAAVYSEHPSTRVISLAYDLGEGEVLWTPGCTPPTELFKHIADGGLIEAHNSGFEYYIWLNVCGRADMSWPPLPLDQLRCSASKARAWGLPGALGKLSEVLNPAEKKDKRGAQLIRLLSVPKKPTKTCNALFRSVEGYPDLYREMYEYNIQDVVAEKAISAMIPELTETELQVWLLDQKINTTGVAIDTEGLQNCLSIFYQAEQKYTTELIVITDGEVQTVGEISKGSAGDKWLIEQGVVMASLDKEHVKDAVDNGNLSPHCKRVLEIRQILGASSVKKLFALERMLSWDDRLRDMFMYCGAGRTGRFAGRGPQPQNLKNSGPTLTQCACGYMAVDLFGNRCPECGGGYDMSALEWGATTTEAALGTIATRSLDAVEAQWGDALEVVGSCLRGLFIALAGHDLVCSDYSAIEAVVLAALAGEEWRLDIFRTHGKIYEASASVALGVPLQEILDHKANTGKHHPLRKKGKVRELANGYGGWVNSSKVFGHTGTDDEIKADILKWREESPTIPEFWGGQWRKEPGVWRFTPELYGLEGAVVKALLYPDNWFTYREIAYYHDTVTDVLYCALPSDRSLAYHKPRLTVGTDPRGLEVQQISYYGKNREGYSYGRQYTYAGKLAENVCQAVARDILVAAMLRVDAAGYPVVLHVHDEIISEVPEGFGSVEEFEKLMMVREPWFSDWPIKAAGGWRGKRYRK